MTLRPSTMGQNRWTAMLIAVVSAFLLSQLLSAAHSSKYGDGPHQHDGQACVLTLVKAGDDKAVSTASFMLFVAFAIWRAADQITQTERALVAIRAARPRGPPSK